MITEIYIAKKLEGGREAVDLVACVKGAAICWHHGLSEVPRKDAEKYASEVAHELRRREVVSYVVINGQYPISPRVQVKKEKG